MSRMLCAYAKCGCLAAAILDCDGDDGPVLEAGMIVDAKEYGWTLQHEERETIVASPCAEHAREIVR